MTDDAGSPPPATGPRTLQIRAAAPLAPRSTLALGGPAENLVEVDSADRIVEALTWAAAGGLDVTVLGGGSNVVIADRGVGGLVLDVRNRGIECAGGRDVTLVTAAAGEDWDELVAWTIDAGLTGLECLSGIPGRVGASPIQNVGAYGQEVARVVHSVRLIDRKTRKTVQMPAAACEFAYRSSRLRHERTRWIVTAVTFALRRGRAEPPQYPELAAALEANGPLAPSAIRSAVIELRRAKSMLVDPGDPNSKSAGSFFLNPVVTGPDLVTIETHALRSGAVAASGEMPRFAVPEGRWKVPAAWLIERSGFPRGTRRGRVAVSPRHALALVNLGGGSAAEIVALASDIQEAVRGRFGLTLAPEPIFLGFPSPPIEGAALV